MEGCKREEGTVLARLLGRRQADTLLKRPTCAECGSGALVKELWIAGSGWDWERVGDLMNHSSLLETLVC